MSKLEKIDKIINLVIKIIGWIAAAYMIVATLIAVVIRAGFK